MRLVLIIYIILSLSLFGFGIYFGWLEIIALVFAILALFPIVTSFFAYYLLAPKLHYDISGKITRKEDDIIYEMMLFVKCKRGKVILKKMFIAGGDQIIPIRHSASTAEFNYLFNIEETGRTLSADFGISETPLSQNAMHGFPISFKSSQRLNLLPIHIVLDIGIDPMKLGVVSVIPIIFNYRYIADVSVDYSDLTSQEGYFRRFYF